MSQSLGALAAALRRSKFSSQYTHKVIHSLTPVPGDLMPVQALYLHRAHTFTKAHMHTHKITKFIV